MRNYREETEKRIDFIRAQLKSADASGLVYGNSGGKDSALVGALCKMACDNTVGVIMPCDSRRNYGQDRTDAERLAAWQAIETRFVDLSCAKSGLLAAMKGAAALTNSAAANIAPRLRMTTLYAIAASEKRLVAGTGNRSEAYMGYFTKWGDAACDLNPIADLTVTEVYAFLRYLGAPEFILKKAPSAALFDGQTDEAELGIAYKDLDRFLLGGAVNAREKAVMEACHTASEHKRKQASAFEG